MDIRHSKSVTKIQLKKNKSQIPIFLGTDIKFDILYAYIYIYVQNYIYICYIYYSLYKFTIFYELNLL